MGEPIYRTAFVVEVFSRGPLQLSDRDDDPFGLLAINYEIVDGDCIGDVTQTEEEVVSPENLQAELVRIGNDGTFFDPVGGEDDDVFVELGMNAILRGDNTGLPPERPVLVARFTPQAWVGDNAVQVDYEGPYEWDASPFLATIDADYRAALLEAVETDGFALEVQDWFKHDPNAPEWVRNWQGPFDIHIERGDL